VIHLVASISGAGFFQGQKWTAELSIPLDFLFLVTVYIYFLRGYWPSPPLFVFFPLFLINTYWKGSIGRGCLLGANLVGMLQPLPDASPFSWPYQKKNSIGISCIYLFLC